MSKKNIVIGSGVAALASLLLAIVGSIRGAEPAAPPQARADMPRMPLGALGTFLDGVHKRDGHEGEQMETVHFCGKVGGEMFQCALFDGLGEGARLVGVEYVITEGALRSLPESERALWHSHAYEVRSGQLVAPELSPAEEHALMATLVNTYGKTWHTWQHDRGDELPIGRPSLMMSITRDGQVLPGLVEKRDAALSLSTPELRIRRADIPLPTLLPGVDRGEGGQSCVGPAAADE